MGNVITNLDQVTPDWLTKVLYEKGVIREGHVSEIRKTAGSFQSATHLEFVYCVNSTPTSVSRLFLKTGRQKYSGINREIEFYSSIAKLMPQGPIVRYYDAACDTETGVYHLLLEDVSNTHFMVSKGQVPKRIHIAKMIDTLAKFHVYWWTDIRLGRGVGNLPTEILLNKDFGDIQRSFPKFVEFMKERLSVRARGVYEQILASFPKVFSKRLIGNGHLTLVHDDAHVWNFLLPRDDRWDQVKIVDWQQWEVSVGLQDVAYLLALLLYPESRRTFEKALVRRYHIGLLKGGITNYGWDKCWNDYRLFCIRNLLIPIWACLNEDWLFERWFPFDRALRTFEDLYCAELLQS